MNIKRTKAFKIHGIYNGKAACEWMIKFVYRIFIIKAFSKAFSNWFKYCTGSAVLISKCKLANFKCEIFCQTVKPGRVYRINSFRFAALSSNRMDSRVLTQMQVYLNKAISCPFSDTLIWTNRSPGGNSDMFVI